MTTDDAATLAALEAELDAPRPHLFLRLLPGQVFALTALLQLALRAPDVPPEVRAVAGGLIAEALAYFADAPTVGDAIRRGNDPTQDRRLAPLITDEYGGDDR